MSTKEEDYLVPEWEQLGIPIDDNAEPDDADTDHEEA